MPAGRPKKIKVVDIIPDETPDITDNTEEINILK